MASWWRTLLAWQPKWLEPVSVLLLGLVLLLRFPGNFALSKPYLMTFEVYRAVALRLLEGGGALLYEPTTSLTALFKYSPVWAALWMPLGWLPAHAGAVVWTTFNLGFLALALWLSAGICRHQGIRYHPLTAVLTVLLLVRPLTSEFLNGNVNVLWGCLVAAFIHSTLVGRRWRAAACLAFAILLKLPAAIFLPYLLLRRQWRPVAAVIAIGGAATIVASAALYPPRPFALIADWLRVLAASGPDRAFEIGNQSAYALLARWLTEDAYGLNVLALSPMTVSALAVGILSAAVGLLALPPVGGASSKRFLYDAAILTALMALFSPTCWVATYSALVFPVFLACGSLTHRLVHDRPDLTALVFAAAATGITLLTHRKVWHLIGVTHWRGETYVFLVFMILPLFAAALVAWLCRQRSLALRA